MDKEFKIKNKEVLPNIFLDDYQEEFRTNKVQPVGWDKQGNWIGVEEDLSNRKKRMLRKRLMPTVLRISKDSDNQVIHVYTTDKNNIYGKL